MRGVEPKGERETRVWNFFTTQDDFWPIREWPPWAQSLAIEQDFRDGKKVEKDHKDYRERYRLFLFWTFNGLNPYTAAGWLFLRDIHKGKFILGTYDAPAVAQLKGMIQQAIRGDLFDRNRRARTYDMILGRPD